MFASSRLSGTDPSRDGVFDEGGVLTASETSRPPRARTSCRLDPGYAVHLKLVAEAATRDLGVKVISARLVEVFGPQDRDLAAFEVESDAGPIRRSRSHVS